MFACSIILAAKAMSREQARKVSASRGEKKASKGRAGIAVRAMPWKRPGTTSAGALCFYDANNDKDKACLALNRQYFDFNESLLIKDLAFIALADPRK